MARSHEHLHRRDGIDSAEETRLGRPVEDEWQVFTEHSQFEAWVTANSYVTPPGWDDMTVEEKSAHVDANPPA